jgi:hypothetical protein
MELKINKAKSNNEWNKEQEKEARLKKTKIHNLQFNLPFAKHFISWWSGSGGKSV